MKKNYKTSWIELPAFMLPSLMLVALLVYGIHQLWLFWII